MKVYKKTDEIDFGKNLVNKRADLVIIDDISLQTEQDRDKYFKYLRETVIPILNKSGKVFFSHGDSCQQIYPLKRSK